MPNCTATQAPFPKLGRRTIDVRFDGGDVSSDGGLLLLRQVEKRLGLLKAVAKVLPDRRNPWLVQHTTEQLLRQRVFGLCQGYEDLNDHDRLRDDLALQTALDKRKPAASSPTLCRFENRATRSAAVATQCLLVEQFIASFARAPEELVLDFDATDDRVHGQQEGRFFHGYYDSYCFLPLYVFCGEQLLVAYLRPATSTLRCTRGRSSSCSSDACDRRGPTCESSFAATRAFAAGQLMRWCDEHDVYYVLGLARNCRCWNEWRSGARQQAARLQFARTSKSSGSLRRDPLRGANAGTASGG